MSSAETREKLGVAAELLLQRANDLFSCPQITKKPLLPPNLPEEAKIEERKDGKIEQIEDIPDDSFELL